MGNCAGLCNKKTPQEREFSVIKDDIIEPKDVWDNENIQEAEMQEINDIKDKYTHILSDLH